MNLLLPVFYGTLVHPAILSRILGSPCKHLIIQNAILPNHFTFKVKGADYPALLDQSRKQQLLKSQPSNDSDSTPSQDSKAVPGTLVRGLSTSELTFLDAFEGKEYQRQQSNVILDPNSASETNDQRPKDESLSSILSSLTPTHMDGLLQGGKLQESCQVYVWVDELDKLENQPWEFATFAREHSHKWVGQGLTEGEFKSENRFGNNEGAHAWEEYSVVDKLRESSINDTNSSNLPDQLSTNSNIDTSLATTASILDPWKEDSNNKASSDAPTIEPSNPWASTTHSENIPVSRKQLERKESNLQEEEGFEFGMEKFGHAARKWWNFAEGYTNLNNGKSFLRDDTLSQERTTF